MPTPLYVIGSANTDMVVKAERLPKPGETIIGGTFMMNAGGKGANQAVAAARLGGQVTYVGNVGNDLFGKQTIEQLEREGIHTKYMTVDPHNPSGVALINVDTAGENSIVVAPGANGHLTPSLIKPLFESIHSPAYVLVQLEIPIATVEYVIKQCVARSVPVILNPAPASNVLTDVLKHVYTITPNESEAEALTGIHIHDELSIQQAATHLHTIGVSHVIITLGKRGAYWSDGTHEGFVAAPLVKATDTTAAGDCFNGALAVALAESKSVPEAVAFACRAASISVTRPGAQASMPTRKEVEDSIIAST